jgi:hypothetical protein
VLAVFAVATTVALENAVRSIRGAHDASSLAVSPRLGYEAFVRRRAAAFLSAIVSMLGGTAVILGLWCILAGGRQLLGMFFLLFGAFMWNEARRLVTVALFDERIRAEFTRTVPALEARIRTVERYRSRDGWLWAAGLVALVAFVSTASRLVLAPSEWGAALWLAAAAVFLWTGIVYFVVVAASALFEGERLNGGFSVLMGVFVVVIWLLLALAALLNAARDLPGLVACAVAILAVSLSAGTLVVRGVQGLGASASMSSLLLWSLRRAVRRRRDIAPNAFSR